MNRYSTSPCMECTDRQVGCHSECEKYKDYRKYLDTTEENRRKALIHYEYKIESFKKQNKPKK